MRLAALAAVWMVSTAVCASSAHVALGSPSPGHAAGGAAILAFDAVASPVSLERSARSPSAARNVRALDAPIAELPAAPPRSDRPHARVEPTRPRARRILRLSADDTGDS
ncbi:MAG: hypothetical protein AB7S26_36960 [Sandaracinaceae bacterium]